MLLGKLIFMFGISKTIDDDFKTERQLLFYTAV